MKNIEISILYDNTKKRQDLIADWGFSALIQTDRRRILFDAGADGTILLQNMKAMDVDPGSIDTVFISHHHFDHTGGLAAFLHENADVEVFVPVSLRGIRRASKVFYLDAESRIDEDVYSTGELEHIEQSLYIKTDAGFVVIVGCSHPGLEKILPLVEAQGHIHALVGGFHGFDKYELLNDIDIICPTHCTQHIKEINKLYPQKYIRGGAGSIMTFPWKIKGNE